jgi:hypothetical protein
MSDRLLLPITPLRSLSVANPESGRPAFMSAASGVARVDNGRVVAIGDDENHFWEGEITGDRPGSFTRILSGTLSTDVSQRKTDKADFEALTVLPPFERNPYGALFAAGSGGMSWNGTRRSMGVVYTLDVERRIQGFPCNIDMTALHEFLEDHVVGLLNIEGMAVWNDALMLAQRGNCVVDGRPGVNALIQLSLDEVLASLLGDLALGPLELQRVTVYDLGVIGAAEAKLDFTDLDAVAGDPLGRLVYTAAAEAPDGSEIAGEIAGSVVGLLDREGVEIAQLELEDASVKLEGVDARYNPERGVIELLLVADADDPSVAAPLFWAELPREFG